MFPEKSQFQENKFALDAVFLSSRFPHGIRSESLIDQNKVRRIYRAQFGVEIPAEVDLPSLLRDSGICCHDKVYFFSERQKSELRDAINALFSEGYRVLYYSELFHRQPALMESCHLYENAALQAVLREILPERVCQDSRVLATPDSDDLNEVLTAYGDKIKLSVAGIQERRPYLSLSAIRSVLSSSEKFVWTEPETYAIINKITLSEYDVRQVEAVILPQMRENGYISLNNLPIQESCEKNPGISPTAIRDVMFLRHMASVCSRRGVIATPKGAKSSAYELMTDYCKTLEQASLGDLKAYRDDVLTGLPDSYLIQAVCACMVRTGADTFVSDTAVAFDVAAVDRAVGLFVNGRIVPITAVTSFHSFPEIEGYAWNLYLLESFLRRFSREYRIMGGPVQISYVGGICPRSMEFESYEDLLAAAVVQDAVPLEQDAIGRYLTEKKYVLRRSRRVGEILRKALRLHEQRGKDGVPLFL